MRLLIVGTHSSQKTGYATVMKGLVPNLAADDVQVFVYGIQSCGPSEYSHIRIHEYDAYAAERRKGLEENGFGFGTFVDYVTVMKPDIIVVYNDPVVIAGYLDALDTSSDMKIPKVYAYVDIVNSRISETNWRVFTHPLVIGIMVFSECWKREVQIIPGYSKPIGVVPHAVHVPIIENARSLAHWEEFGNDIVFVNLNRNTHRKRLDVYACAAARFLARNPDAPVRFLANSHHESAFDLHSIALRELVACGIEDPMPLLNRIMINRTMLTDEMVTYIHNACDVAVNCSEGEGFGLCVAEAACVGKPVIVSGVGGALDLFGSRIPTALPVAYIVHPVAEYFLDGRDGIGGCAQLVSVNDLVNAFEHFMHAEHRSEYGKRARAHMASRPSWKDISKTMMDFIRGSRGGNTRMTTSGIHA